MKDMSLASLKCAVLAIALTLISQAVVNGQEPPVVPRGFGIVGTWDLETTFVECTSGVPVQPPGPKSASMSSMSMKAPPKALLTTSTLRMTGPAVACQPFQYQLQSAGITATWLPIRLPLPS